MPGLSPRSHQGRIEVILHDGTHYELSPRELDVMLDNDWVMKFKRSSGWVTVGVHPVRAKARVDLCPVYYGVERRRSVVNAY